MESGRRNQTVDMTGRTLAVAGLLIAIGAGCYAVFGIRTDQNGEDPIGELKTQVSTLVTQQDQLRKDLSSQLETAIARNDKRADEWNRRMNAATATFTKDGENLRSQLQQDESEARQQRYTAFKQALADFRGELVADTKVPDEEPEVKNDVTLPTETSPGTAQLTLADTRLRPASGDTTLVRLENNSGEDVLIRRIRFKPESDFRADADKMTATGTEDVVTIAYHKSDNMSTNPGHHGLYVRELESPIRVPADESLTMRVVIEDADHNGWGFVGQLMVEYNSEKPLIIKVARVRFDDIQSTGAEADALLKEST